MSDLIRRRDSVEALIRQYSGAPFAWGRNDCVRLVARHLRALGHRVSLVKAGSYRSELGAVRALKRAGFDRLEDALDARFVRINPAEAFVGDIIGLESGGEWPALTLACGHGRVFGFISDVAAVMQPKSFKTAWRVECHR